MSMTGIETFAAMLLVSEIGDITRFKTADRLVSWTGMCPRVYQSGNVTHSILIKDPKNWIGWTCLLDESLGQDVTMSFSNH